MTDARRVFDDITRLLSLVSEGQQERLTPRQQQGLKGAEACVMLCAHPGKLELGELDSLAKAGLVFGAVLAGER